MWREQGILTDQEMESIQQRIDDFEVLSDLGRIINTMKSGLASFTADQWTDWTLFPLLDVWRLFVKACYLLYSYIITNKMLADADMELVTLLQERSVYK